ncbi:phosphoribosylformylglycinamidine synthase [Taibaiella lutea]|uniref:Phosphoribosylformylglycinamidine synthase n=1 Tax=Taibaiella lutea TaxID=2608001 RepID=A0A5M6CNQ0_9BACT|nr:phosphoribosylformylglycinamidine synthase [Taibaiella lutea]KAA5536764.1 phosphoribosylformylglycinamidine synthase [Taibaiella lutea]
MMHFFGKNSSVFAVQTANNLSDSDISKLSWLFGDAASLGTTNIVKEYVGPRAAMITPWSTNAVEITQNMGIEGIQRIEEFMEAGASFDPMLFQQYKELNQDIFTINITPEPIIEIEDIAAYNKQEGLALSDEEVKYLNDLSEKLGRKLTDSEVFGFSQVNSEHCRHKIFNGTFVIDGKEQPTSLFKLIKKTSSENPNYIVSAYKDNVAFIQGPRLTQFAPINAAAPSNYQEQEFDSVISLKAETHNFPTTVEPFNGAATGSGGEIRDRLAGGQGSLPLAGTAVYMTAYSRLEEGRNWENGMPERKWLYQNPKDILVKASNGASDFGNKFGQPLITGSVLTFEHEEHKRKLAFDKVIMLAGGVGYGKHDQSKKQQPQTGDKIVVLGGDNYRIGMGGAAVSSADTGAFGSGIELNAIQRSNPEMQKRVANTIRGVVESNHNIITSIHDHGAGGHLNCLSELVESTGGKINLDKLPVGDPTLSAKEIIGNESQERMGLVVPQKHIDTLREIADRERSPMFVVGEVTGDHRFTIASEKTGDTPMDFHLEDMFGSSPKTIMDDKVINRTYESINATEDKLYDYLNQVLQLEAVACKDWLTNKVDRCVGGRVAKQQCAGPLQLPLNNMGVMALDYKGKYGVATSIGHAPAIALIDEKAGSRHAIAESLSNIVWAPLSNGLKSVSLSANWMWPCKNEGEDARLYNAVEACSEFAIALGINIPTGKDSLSMKQKYADGEVIAPGTVIISAGAQCDDISKIVEPVLQKDGGDIYYVNLSEDQYKLGGSSLAQVLNKLGNEAPDVKNAGNFKTAFNTLQQLIKEGKIQAGHDIGSGGLITTLLEMCFADNNLGAALDLTALGEADSIKLLFAENIAVVFQGDADAANQLKDAGIAVVKIGKVVASNQLTVTNHGKQYAFDIAALRDTWFKTSYLLDKQQSGAEKAKERFENYKSQPLRFRFPQQFDGKKPVFPSDAVRPKAGVIREKGSNSERELAQALFLAGFDVKDIHMTDLVSGRENLEDVQFLGAVGGFSNSDVLGSAKGWAGAFKYNPKAKEAIEHFFKRNDTLSIGICNGCQLFVELGLIYPDHKEQPRMLYNDSHKHESGFTSMKVQDNNSVMFSSLAGSTIGVWISHGEGKFYLPAGEGDYKILGKYGYDGYPANPNGSGYSAAMISDDSGRHVVTMPHIERSIFQWQWAHYPAGRKDEVSPWMEAFVNARNWLITNQAK